MDLPAGESHQEVVEPLRPLRRRGGRRRGGDSGFTLVEVIVSITLLGVAAGSVLASLASSTTGSARHRELSTATAWLQSATDYLEVSPMEVCGTSASVAAVYQSDIRDDLADPDDAFVANSDGWASTAISVTGVKFWDGSAFGTTCYDDLQLVTLRVASPNGKVTQTLDFVKGTPYADLTNLPDETDAYSSCAFSSWTWTSQKTGVVSVVGGKPKVALKKPSATKQSKVIDDHITITVKVTGNCNGKLRLRYQWPHLNKNGTLKHYHTRRINLKLVKGGDGKTYVGKLGHHGDKFLSPTTIDVFLEQGRTRSKTWAIVGTAQVIFG